MSANKSNKIQFSRTHIVIAIVSVIFGAILGWGIQNLFLKFSSMSIWLISASSLSFITCVVVLYYVPALSSFSIERYNEMLKLTYDTKIMLEDALNQRAQIIPREFIYPEMARCLRDAQKEVAVVTLFMYDWDKGERTFLPKDQILTGKEDFYEAIYECIQKPNVEYTRIWQVPTERKNVALETITKDPFHQKEIELIQKISRHKPDQAKLIIADQLTTASFILVDRKNLYINIDFYDKKENIWYSPYMIFIKDTTEKAFVELNSIIVRLTLRLIDEN